MLPRRNIREGFNASACHCVPLYPSLSWLMKVMKCREDDDEDYHEFGFAEVNLHTLLNGGDMIHHEVDVHGHSNNEVVATLTLTIIAQKALRGILEDTAP